MLQELSAFN